MEPTAQDVNAVAQHLGEPAAPQAPVAPQQPAPQAPAPAPVQQPDFTPGVSTPAPQQQPAQPAQQPAPTQQPQDPFSMFAAQPQQQPQPTQQPTEPVPTPQPQQPAEPSQPAPQAQPQGQPQGEPAQPAQPQGEPQYQTFEQYMESITQGLPEPPATPDPTKIDPTDEKAIQGFFDDLVSTAVDKATAISARNTAIQNTERQLWDAALDKYPSLRQNTKLRDTVHSIRMAQFNKGVAMTPTQAADELAAVLRNQHQQGVADATVVTTIQQTQPTGGGGQPVPTMTDANNLYKNLQVGGEEALAAFLDAEIKAGRM